MKKYVVEIILSALVLIGIFSAFFGNPLKWFDSLNFNKEYKNEVLENRIKELENKIEESQKNDSNIKPAPETLNQVQQYNSKTVVGGSAQQTYYNESKIKVTQNIQVHEDYKKWLESTKNEFRTISAELSTHTEGGTYKKLRDASIDLADSNVKVIERLEENTKEWIDYWTVFLNAFNSKPDIPITKSEYEGLQGPDVIKSEIDGIKKSINTDLESVKKSLEYY